MAMMIKFTMPKGCAITVTTSMEERRNHGIAHMTSSTLQGCARTVTSTIITERKERRKSVIKRTQKSFKCKAVRLKNKTSDKKLDHYSSQLN